MSDIDHPSDTIFPPELEYVIFKLAAGQDRGSIPRLMLVAWRVKEWIEPLMYQPLLFESQITRDNNLGPVFPFERLPQLSPNVAAGVKSSIFPAASVLAILDKLPSLENVFLSVAEKLYTDSEPGEPLPAAFTRLPFRHLYCALGDLLFLPALDSLEYHCFAGLTHFELFSEPTRWGVDTSPWPANRNSWALIAALPSLTHFALNNVYPASLIGFLLSACTRLTCLVLLSVAARGGRYPPAVAHDPRFVVMRPSFVVGYLRDWVSGAEGGPDYWARADAFIAERRARQRTGGEDDTFIYPGEPESDTSDSE
ncbi:hypothetical protein MIND_00655000 [Mycena indigotica]|uniref:Uncharacterized protein n=1 Tax=Mycena indigotica TaxID=2126181 RepID=A0A8H6ST50_9AGAR|nr:uncharacterized protein MIND_00655000 [Mycena indigotica]KAF7304226.1 hypothetical protein MIND_00655000 [Mycena indigotica]